MDKTGWRRYQKRSLIPGQPHRPLERDKTEEPLSRPPTQEQRCLLSSRALPSMEWIWTRLGAGVCVTKCAPWGHSACPLSVSSAASPRYLRTAPAPSVGAPGLHVFTGYQCETCHSAKGRLTVPRFSDCWFHIVRCLQRLSAGWDAPAAPSGGFYSQFIHCLQEPPEQEFSVGTRAGCTHVVGCALTIALGIQSFRAH